MNKNTFHILVVDDDDKIRELVKEYLIKNNFLVTTAKDAFDAKKKLEIVKFDILILEIIINPLQLHALCHIVLQSS